MHDYTRRLVPGYVVAVLAVAGATLLRWLFDPLLGDHLPFVTFFVAVVVASWYGGLRPGFVATVLGFLLALYLFVPPRFSFLGVSGPHLVGLAMYFLVSLAITTFGEAMHAAQRRSRRDQEAAHGQRQKIAALSDDLRKRVEELTDFFENATVGLHWVGPDGTILRANRAELAMLGYAPEEYVGRHIADFHTDRPVIEDILRRLHAAETLRNYPARMTCKDGSVKDVLIDSSVMWEDGRFIHTRCFTRDVTDRRQAEADLRESERRFKTLASHAPVGIFETDPEGNCLFVNERWCEMAGLSSEQARGQGWVNALHPEDRDRIFREWYDAATEGREFACEYRFRTPQGKVTWLSGSAVALRADTGQIAGYIGTVTDITQRKQAEQAVRAAQQELQIVTEAMSAAITRCSRDLRYRWVSRPYADWIGRAPAEIIGRPIIDILGPEAFAHLRPYFERVLAGEQVRYEEAVNFRGPGRRWVNAVYTPTFDAAGAVDGWVAVVLDLEERRQMEEALRQSEQRFARFMQHLPGLAWIKDLQGRYVYANDTAMKVFGCPHDRLYGKTDDDVFPPEAAAQFKANDAKVLASGTGVQVIETLEHEDGVVHHSIVSKFPIPGPDGSPALVGGMAIDITDRLRAEAVLAESEQRFRQLAENIDEVFWMADPKTTEILYISPAYEQVWGRSCQSLYDQPRSFLDAVHPDDRERVRFAALEKHGRGEPTDEEYRVVRPDGSVRWVRDRAFPVRDARGQVYRMVGIAEDVTEKRRAEEALREADRRKDEFLATLAHELRNPLAPVRNALQIMRLAGTNGQAVEQARAMMDRQVGQMVRLIDDLLDVSRITRGKLALRRERVDLAAAVNCAIETASPLIEAAGHELTVSLPPGPVHLDADPTRLAQVFGNLLANAAKFTDRGGHIRLTAERQGSDVVVSVKDNGIGIPADRLPRLFEMFSQVAPALERSQGGLGIGLSLVKGLVGMHGGSVEARSDGPGKGSEFIVRLPVPVQRQAERPKQADGFRETLARPKCRILVVDDLPDTADSLTLMLELMGHHIRTAHDGLEAVQMAERFRPDVVLLDIGLPKLNGYEAARRIREQPWGQQMVLVAVTGWGQEEDKRRSQEAGFNSHLVKPVEPAALERLLAGLKSVNA